MQKTLVCLQGNVTLKLQHKDTHHMATQTHTHTTVALGVYLWNVCVWHQGQWGHKHSHLNCTTAKEPKERTEQMNKWKKQRKNKANTQMNEQKKIKKQSERTEWRNQMRNAKKERKKRNHVLVTTLVTLFSIFVKWEIQESLWKLTSTKKSRWLKSISVFCCSEFQHGQKIITKHSYKTNPWPAE